MEKYNKIFKWLMLALILIGVILLVWGFGKGYPATPAADNGTVDPLLYWAYALVGIAVCCWVVFGLIIKAINDVKSLIKIGVRILVAAVICLVVYLVSPGAPAQGLLTEQPSHSTLKLTDTVLNLTYVTACATIIAIIAGEIFSAVRNK